MQLARSASFPEGLLCNSLIRMLFICKVERLSACLTICLCMVVFHKILLLFHTFIAIVKMDIPILVMFL